MVTIMIAAAVATILGALSALHLYWAAGGAWGAAASVPEANGKPAFTPGPLACVVVAVLLATAAALVLATARGAVLGLPWVARLGTAVVSLVFLARAVGDFKMIGFSKRVGGTRFAELDTRLYSPLCLALSAGCAFVAAAAAG
jgi:hypothetical protein